MRFRRALLVATILATPLAARAQPVTGLYVGAGVGANWHTQQSIQSITGIAGPLAGINLGLVNPTVANNFFGTGTNTGLDYRYNLGWVGLGSIGYGLGNGLRFELEGNFRRNRVHSLTPTSFPTASGGNNNTYGAMGNVFYDFDIAPYTGITWMYPYVGVGAGYAWSTMQAVKSYGIDVPVFLGTHGTSGNFAYQAMVGASFPIQPVPGLSVTAEYRFFGTTGNLPYPGVLDAGATPATYDRTFIQVKTGPQYNHSALVGLRYAFNVAPPPPPPAPVVAPAPAPARSYLVFFDWDKATLTDRARQIIREAAENSTRVQYTRIEVNGYTDTSGTAAYNQRLSVRRAEAVAAELVRNGVPRNAITVQGFGETHLLVPTGLDVREPQNRRVEIIIR
jgi:OmpA-OmpF porin, OOP family